MRTPPSILAQHAPALAQAAQDILDAWQQDAQGWDERYGTGGACSDVADAMAGVLTQAGLEAGTSGTEFDGGHAFVLALIDGAVWNVDIPAHVYEHGYGYQWTKKTDVAITHQDVSITWVASGVDPDDWPQWLEG